jgi:hypothetical protein
VDEIKLFEELEPPPPPDAARMRDAARARLIAATCAAPGHEARRRNSVVAVAAAAALVAAGTGYGLAAARSGGPNPARSTTGGSGTTTPHTTKPSTAAGLTAVLGCPGMYITAGTLEQVSGTRAILESANGPRRITVATSASTVITRSVTGTLGDVTDGSHVSVIGTWSGAKLAATEVSIGAALPATASKFPVGRSFVAPRTLRPPKGFFGPPFAGGTVTDAHDGGFTVIMRTSLTRARRIVVTTSSSTEVRTQARSSLGQLSLGDDVVAVGQVARNRVLTAGTVAESPFVQILVPGGLSKLRTSGCSASAITTAVVFGGS